MLNDDLRRGLLGVNRPRKPKTPRIVQGLDYVLQEMEKLGYITIDNTRAQQILAILPTAPSTDSAPEEDMARVREVKQFFAKEKENGNVIENWSTLMRSKTLFPLDEPLAPSADRPEPLLWLRRLVILRDLDSLDAPIRDIPFRRGLNIIQARQRGPGESKVVGHSVGKTLLMRLIRYSLGEQHFAVEPVRNRIAAHPRCGPCGCTLESAGDGLDRNSSPARSPSRQIHRCAI